MPLIEISMSKSIEDLGGDYFQKEFKELVCCTLKKPIEVNTLIHRSEGYRVYINIYI